MNSDLTKNELPFDFQTRICKKISQLTRVIVQLNVLNDESDLNNKRIISTFEKEMSQHSKNARRKYEEERQKLSKELKTSQLLSSEIEKVKSYCESEKTLLRSKMSTVEKEVSKSNFIQEIEDRLKEKEIKLNSAFLSIKNLEEKFLKVKNKYEVELKTKADEINRLKNDLSSKNLSTQSEKSHYEKVIEKLQVDLAAAEQMFQDEKVLSLKKDFTNSEQIKALETKISHLLSQLEQSAFINSELKSNVLSLNLVVEGLSGKIINIESIITEKDIQIKSLNEENFKIKLDLDVKIQECSKLKEEKTNISNDLEKISNKLKDFQEINSKYQLEISNMAKSFEEKQSKLEELQILNKNLKTKIDSLDQMLRSSKGNYSELVSSLNNQISEKDNKMSLFNTQISNLEKSIRQMDQEKKENELIIKDLKKEVEEKNEKIIKLEKNIIFLENKLKLSEQENEKSNIKLLEQVKISDDQKLIINQLNVQKSTLEQNLKEVQNLNQLFKSQIENMEKMCQDRLCQIETLTSKVDEMSSNNIKTIGSSAEQINNLQNIINQQSQKQANLITIIKNLKDYQLKIKSQFMKMITKRTNLKIDSILTKNESIICEKNQILEKKHLSKNHKNNLSEIFSDLEKKSREKIAFISSKLSIFYQFIEQQKMLKTDLRNSTINSSEIDSKNIHLLKIIDQLNLEQKNYQTKMEQMQEIISQNERKIIDLTKHVKSLSSENQIQNIQLEDIVNQLKRDLADLKKKHENELKLTKEESSNILTKINEENNEKITSLKNQLSSMILQKNEEIMNLSQNYELQLSSLKNKHDSLISEINTNHQNKLSKIRQDLESLHIVQMKSLREEYEAKMREIGLEKENLVRNLNTVINSLKTENSAVNKKNVDLLKDIENLNEQKVQQENELRKKNDEISKIVDCHLTEIRSLNENIKTQKLKFEQEIKNKYETFKQGLENTMKSMMTDQERLLDEIRVDFEQELREKEMNLKEIQQLFRQRPSKTEDLDHIFKINENLKKKQAELAQVQKQLQFFRLELVNRDKNYNEIFNSNPYVGVLDPVSQQNLPSIANLPGKENSFSQNGTKASINGLNAQKMSINLQQKVASKQFSIKTILK